MTHSIPTTDSRHWSRYRTPCPDGRTAFTPGVLDRRPRQLVGPAAVRTAPAPATPPAVSRPGPATAVAAAATPDAGPLTEPLVQPPPAAGRSYTTQHLLLDLYDHSTSEVPYRAVTEVAKRELVKELRSDRMAAYAIQIAEMQFAADRVESTAFVPAAEWAPKDLLGWGGNTPLGRALGEALPLIEKHKEGLRRAGVPIGKSLLIVHTDGAASDPDLWDRVLPEVHRAERENRISVYPVGVGQVAPALNRLSCKRPAAVIDEDKIPDFFRWLATCLLVISKSVPDEEIELPPTDGWRVIK